MNDQSTNRIDPAPFYWALAIVALLVAVWLAFRFFGDQRFHNTAFWQQLRPVVLISPPQTVQRVEVSDGGRNALTVVQTKRGLYFLSGAKHRPVTGDPVVVQANDHWELYLCAPGGERCMTIHSFCANATVGALVRNERGQIEDCYAPSVVERPAAPPEPAKPDVAARGPGKKMKRLAPPVGTSHPREWAWRMGLPVPAP
jgi:hypothetical protein